MKVNIEILISRTIEVSDKHAAYAEAAKEYPDSYTNEAAYREFRAKWGDAEEALITEVENNTGIPFGDRGEIVNVPYIIAINTENSAYPLAGF